MLTYCSHYPSRETEKKYNLLFVLISEGLKISIVSHLCLITVACDCLITPVTVHLNIRKIQDESILVALEYITLSTLELT